jgi:hypothetical protein
MQDDFEAFLIRPTRVAYEQVRAALFADPAFRAEPFELAEVEAHCAAGEFKEAREQLEGVLYDWALSPRMHALAAWAALGMGDEADAELERFTSRMCLAGLLATGNGSFASPFLVTYPSDEYDLLAALGREPRSQQLIDCDSGRFDVLTCADGGELWFDVTALLRTTPTPIRPLVRTSA